MNSIKIRYTFRHKGSGNIEMKWYSIGQLEERAAAKLSPVFSDEYELISRDLYTGLKDKNGREKVYEMDIVKFGLSNQIGVICYDIHQAKFKIVPVQFYHANAGCGGWTGHSLRKTVPMEVIGNIYQNPDLLLEAAEEC